MNDLEKYKKQAENLLGKETVRKIEQELKNSHDSPYPEMSHVVHAENIRIQRESEKIGAILVHRLQNP